MQAVEKTDWLEERRLGIGASDMSDLFQIEPYGCQRRLWYDKRGTMPDYPPEETLAMQRGSELEKIIAERWAREKHTKVFRVHEAIVHSAYPWARAHIDRRILRDGRGPGILEVKTANQFVF